MRWLVSGLVLPGGLAPSGDPPELVVWASRVEAACFDAWWATHLLKQYSEVTMSWSHFVRAWEGV